MGKAVRVIAAALAAGFCAYSTCVLAQLVVTPLNNSTNNTTQCIDLVTRLLGPGITVVPGSVSCTPNIAAFGTFSGGTSAVGFDSGIMLSSGSVASVTSVPNIDNTGDGFSNTPTPDADLESLIPSGSTLYDKAVLEFNFVPTASQVTFEYVFASEEYNEFANTAFNDVFGFFVNGANKALLPVQPPVPVSINTVNGGNPLGMNSQNPSFFINNDPSDGGGEISIQADGLTVVLRLTATVMPNQTNHMKLAI